MAEEKIKSALIKCATGLKAKEVVEEFCVQDGELKLVKRKVTKREIPPDIKAMKMLLEDGEEVSDNELLAERENLVKMLKEIEDD